MAQTTSTSTVPFSENKRYIPWIFLAPFLLLFLLFKVYPVFYALFLSFTKLNSIGETAQFIGMANYARLFSDPSFLKAIRITFFYTAGILLVLIPIPLILAALLQSGWVGKPTGQRLILFTPALTSLVVATIVFRWMLLEEGVLSEFLSMFGVAKRNWVTAGIYTIPIIVAIAFWRWTGMNIVYFQSGLNNIPREMFEAAAIDGANALESFYYVTMPLLKPIILFVVTLTVIGGFQVFVEPYLLYNATAGPGENGLTMTILLYRLAFQQLNFGYASAVGVVLALIILVVSLIQFKAFGFFQREE